MTLARCRAPIATADAVPEEALRVACASWGAAQSRAAIGVGQGLERVYRHSRSPQAEQRCWTVGLRIVHQNQIAPAGAAALYVDDADEAADRLGLRGADAGANVVLLERSTPSCLTGPPPATGCAASPPASSLWTCSRDRDANRHRARNCSAGCRTTRMPGEPDPQYVRARGVLLDAARPTPSPCIHGRVLRILRPTG